VFLPQKIQRGNLHYSTKNKGTFIKAILVLTPQWKRQSISSGVGEDLSAPLPKLSVACNKNICHLLEVMKGMSRNGVNIGLRRNVTSLFTIKSSRKNATPLLNPRYMLLFTSKAVGKAAALWGEGGSEFFSQLPSQVSRDCECEPSK